MLPKWQLSFFGIFVSHSYLLLYRYHPDIQKNTGRSSLMCTILTRILTKRGNMFSTTNSNLGIIPKINILLLFIASVLLIYPPTSLPRSGGDFRICSRQEIMNRSSTALVRKPIKEVNSTSTTSHEDGIFYTNRAGDNSVFSWYEVNLDVRDTGTAYPKGESCMFVSFLIFLS